MPSHFEFDVEHKVLLFVLEGEVGNAEILGSNSKIAEQASRLHPASVIADVSGITKLDVSSDVIRSAARRPTPNVVEAALVIVAPQEHLFGMARMYEMVGSRTRPNLKIARTREEALAGLGVPNAKFERLGSS